MIRFLPPHNVLLRRMCLRRASMALVYHPIAPFHLTTTTMSDSGLSQSPESPAILAKREKIQSLRDSISHKQPAASEHCQFRLTNGPFPTAEREILSTILVVHLFFFAWSVTNGLIISRINLSNPSEADLQDLSDACQPATFGVNKEDVLDESYRKAGKMDVADFTTNFVVEDLGLMDVIRSELLEGHESNKAIKAELYKLNVYGEGSS